MNDEKKETNPAPGSLPDPPSGADDNPWDEDDGGGRTLATDGPSFEMPSNIPSPITVPPPPMQPPGPKFPMKHPPTATLVGLMPEDNPYAQIPPLAPPAAVASAERAALVSAAFSPAPAAAPVPAAPRPPAAPPRPSGPASGRMPVPPPPSSRMLAATVAAGRGSAPDAPPAPPVALAPPSPAGLASPAPAQVVEEDDLEEFGNQEDGPTMAVASPTVGRPLRDDTVNPRAAPPVAPLASSGFIPPVSQMMEKDADAETMAARPGDPRLQMGHEGEETTRAISRDEMMRHQDAHVIVGQDAIGEDATLAIAPGQFNLGLLGGGGPDVLQSREEAPHRQSSGHLGAGPPAPYMQQPVPGGPPMHGQPPQSWQGEGAAQSWQADPQAYRSPPQGFDPMMPQPMHGMPGSQQSMQGGPFPSSGHQQAMQGVPGPPQSNPQGWGPPPNANAGGPMHPQQYMQGPMAGQPAPQQWAPQSPPAAGLSLGGMRVTPQVLLLAGVGVVCLAIFVIGIVLFVTTKF